MSKSSKQKIINEGAYNIAEIEIDVSVPRSKYNYGAIAETLKAGKKWVCAPTITKNKVARILNETRKLMPNTKLQSTLEKKQPADPDQFVIFATPTATATTT